MPKWEYRIMEIEMVDSRFDLLSVDGKTIEQHGKSHLPLFIEWEI